MVSYHFHSLPNELKVFILLALPMESILLCRRVSRKLNALIEGSSAIQYKIELAAHDLVQCTSYTVPAATALQRLREQQNGWRRCQWKHERMVHIQGGCRTYELRNGVWAFGHCDTAIQNSTSLPPDYTTTIACYRLPSMMGSEDSREVCSWSLGNFGMSIRDFTIDPTIDLLAIIEQTTTGSKHPFRLHLRRLLNGKPHPMAAKKSIDLDMTNGDPSACAFGVQLQASFVGVLVCQGGTMDEYDYFAVWNWQSGNLEMSKTAKEFSFDDFAFIDNSSVMLAVLNNRVTLEIWRFENSKSYFTGSFEMPLTTMSNTYWEMHFDSGPTASVGGPLAVDGTPYSLAPETDILSITFGVVEVDEVLEGSHVASFTMVMRPSLMLNKLKEKISGVVRHQIHGASDAFALTWQEWGPWCTRWIQQEVEDLKWEPSAAGGRFVVVTPDRDTSDPTLPTNGQVIRIFDFRRDVVSRYGRLHSKSLSEETNISESRIPKDTMFVEDIISSLPYHVVESIRLPYKMSGIMMDEGRLICTKAEEDDEWRSLLVLTF